MSQNGEKYEARTMTRRQFVRRSSAITAAIGLPVVVPSTSLGANDKIRVAVIGLGGRGAGTHVTCMGTQDDVAVVAICDPDRDRLDRTAGNIKGKHRFDVDTYVDMREIMKR